MLHILKIWYNNNKKEALLTLACHIMSHPLTLIPTGQELCKYLLNLHFITEVILDPIFYSESRVYLFLELFAAQ